ncbi:Rha family transcriptional regulator [Salmonella enterica subsp. enterica]|nr:Rha family transcriptional regulator [Salmonella enterica subsp. enterica]
MLNSPKQFLKMPASVPWKILNFSWNNRAGR